MSQVYTTITKKHFTRQNILFVYLFISTLFGLYYYYVFTKQEIANKFSKFIIVDKATSLLSLYDYSGNILAQYPVSVGEKPGNKRTKGDLKTPEGIFPIIAIQEAANWKYDFKDGEGPIKGAYGPFFFRLRVSEQEIFDNASVPANFTVGNKFKGIGIHGTHMPQTIGQRTSHGCVRMKNQDLLRLKSHIYHGLQVAILPAIDDVLVNEQCE